MGSKSHLTLITQHIESVGFFYRKIQHIMSQKFRADINGLRAFAVIAVVLFHFNPSWVPGGFAGVDVFFVISGFLMTGIIFRGLEQNNFSILKFYVARANRIIPALAVLCLVLLAAGWFYLIPLEYTALGKHAASSISFLSNFVYMTESGYFNASSHEKWLLHTWSLSVEWQFYIIYPIVLVLLAKIFSIKTIKSILLVGTVLGFILCVIATHKWPNPSYYLLPTRAWEMMIGGIAYLYPLTLKDNKKKILELSGLTLIIGSYFFISSENLWPGYLAIFPVIGSFLVIQAQRNDSFITGNAVFQNIGSWSYSIYLWHWPLVVAIYIFSLNELYTYAGIVLSIILGFISYKYIERIKFKGQFSTIFSYLKCKPIYIAGFVGVLGFITYKTNGFIWHYSDDVIQASNEAKNRNPYKCMVENKFPCYIGNPTKIKAIVIGDSHADSLTTSVANVFDLNSEGIIALTKSSCPFVLNMKSVQTENTCLEENSKRMDFLNKNHTTAPVFWISRTGVYLFGQTDPKRVNSSADTKPTIYFTKKYDDFDKALLIELEKNLGDTVRILSKNRQVFLVLPTPEMKRHIPKNLANDLLLRDKLTDLSSIYKDHIDRNKPIIDMFYRISAKHNNVKVLDPANLLCDQIKCIATYNNRPIYYDGDHMSEYGNKLLTPMFREAL